MDQKGDQRHLKHERDFLAFEAGGKATEVKKKKISK